MTLLELVGYLRKNILHDLGGTGTDWSSWSEDDYDSIQLRWSNEELVGYINEAINQVYRRTNPIKDFYQLDIEKDVHTYPIPSYILEILKVKGSNGRPLEEKSMDDFWDLQTYNTFSNEPNAYFPDVEQGNIRIYPIPISDDTLDMMVYRLPKTKLSWDDPSNSPELREEYQVPMLLGAASLCYMKDEANTLDPQRANTLTAMFDREFPFTSSYSNIRKGRTTNRPVSYGGIGGKVVKRYNYQNRSDRY
jgi:hypothetical protein